MCRPAVLTPLILTLVLLAGCAIQRSQLLPEMPDWPTRQAVLGDTDRWEFSGRIGVSAGDKGFNGKLWWWQRDEHFAATVSGPFGVGTMKINGEGRQATVRDKDGTVTELADAEPDLRAMYGWTIPVTSLRYWTLGIPDPMGEAVTEFDAEGRLVRLVQRDWIVTIGQYRDGGGQPMPRRISAVNDDAKVRLVIDNWIFY